MNRRLLLFLIPLVLTGCWDTVEIENRAFVISVGIDKSDGGQFAVSLAIPDTSAITGDSGGGGKMKTVEEAEDTSIPGAIGKIGEKTSRSLYFGHAKIVVFGGELLGDEKMFREALDFLEKNYQTGRKINILAAEGTASEMLRGGKEGYPAVGLYVSELYRYKRNGAAGVSKKSFDELSRDMNTAGSTIIPRISLDGDGQAELGGAAVIRGNRLAGFTGTGQGIE